MAWRGSLQAMPERSSSRRKSNELASPVSQRLCPGSESVATHTSSIEKNPAAVALGRLGGLRGGPARAKSLTARRRREIARKAANARWKRHSEPT